jgi:hypothetical protein
MITLAIGQEAKYVYLNHNCANLLAHILYELVMPGEPTKSLQNQNN